MRNSEAVLRWRGVLTLLALVVMMPLARAAASWNIDTLLGAIRARHPTTIHYHEAKRMQALIVPLRLTGTLTFQPPDRLEKRVDPPYAESYVIQGQYVIYQHGSTRRRLDLQDYPALAALAAALRGVLNGNPALLRRYYRLTLHGARADWRLTLTPRQAAMGRYVKAIEISGKTDRLLDFRIDATDGDIDTLTFDAPPR